VRATALHEEDDFRSVAEAETGHPLSTGGVSSFWLGKALDHVSSEPAFAAEMMGRKLLLLVADYELPDNQDMYFVARESPVLRLPLPTFGWILPPALLGISLGLRRRETQRLALLVAAFGASIVVFFVQARFRMPAMPVLSVFAASGGAWLFGILRERRWRIAALTAAPLVVVAFVSARMPANQDPTVHRALDFQNFGALYARTGEIDRATLAYRESLRLAPGNVEAARALDALGEAR
jgi:hypothetical protein